MRLQPLKPPPAGLVVAIVAMRWLGAADGGPVIGFRFDVCQGLDELQNLGLLRLRQDAQLFDYLVFNICRHSRFPCRLSYRRGLSCQYLSFTFEPVDGVD